MKQAHPWDLVAVTLALLGTSCRDDSSISNKTAPEANTALEVVPEYEVRRFVVQFPYEGDSYEENVYLLLDRTSKQGIIVDPGSRSPELEAVIASAGITIKGILNTHGHFDHTGANGFYARKYQTDVCVHSGDESL